uniref:Putative small molecule transporter involved in cellular ph homeostasis batten disease protein in n=1 Tax=Ixodes ricinus TaxID=34613 RepID=A0A0K8R5K8_IXORI
MARGLGRSSRRAYACGCWVASCCVGWVGLRSHIVRSQLLVQDVECSTQHHHIGIVVAQPQNPESRKVADPLNSLFPTSCRCVVDVLERRCCVVRRHLDPSSSPYG